MVSGAPDYYSWALIDIMQQTLAELQIWRNLGASNTAIYSGVPATYTTSTLISVTGRGTLVYGIAIQEGDAAAASNELQIYIDGNFIAGMSSASASAYQINIPEIYPIYSRLHDTVMPAFVMGLGTKLTFESSLEIRYVEMNGQTGTVTVQVIFGVI